jgi:5-methylcytosine-specific restriction endonuclease McrA
MSRAHPFQSRHGRRVRAEQLEAEPWCADCRASGIARPATVVHHIRPVSRGGAPYDPANLMSLCTEHHADRHDYRIRPLTDPATGLPVGPGRHPWSTS